MAERPFVHLHCHSHYSLLDGASRIPELVAHVKAQGMNACALTDHGNLFGAIEFYKECKAAGVNPIVGYEAYVAPAHRTDREAKKRGDAGYHLTLLAKNQAGFKNLIKLGSIAYTEGFHYVPRIDKEVLAAHSEGLICLSGCASSEFSEYILKEQMAEAKEVAVWFHKTFGQNFYVEIQNNGLEIQRRCAEGAKEIASSLGLPLVATSDAHYLRQGDAIAHDILLCINTGRLQKDENRMRYGSDQFHVRPPEQMYELFPGDHDAVKRSQEIADGVDIQLDFKKRHFPVFTPPTGLTAEEYLRKLCDVGLEERYGKAAPKDAQARYEDAKKRLDHEIGVISRMGFASYFLIVWDFVRFSNEHDIMAGARGSACGAIVAYLLKLSHVCPLEYDLLFERFLDPNRSEAPDIDIDFCQDNRERVIDYVREKYGSESVAQIATFGTMAAKAAIKDVGRVLDVPLETVNRLTAAVPKVLNISLEESLEKSPDLKKEYDGDARIKELIDIALKLEGTNRNVGTHAAGVVIGSGPITDHVPVQRVARKNQADGAKTNEFTITTQWTMGDLEAVGMLKMDFLGLRTLTVVDHTLKLIAKTRLRGRPLEEINDIDPRTYRLLKFGIDRVPMEEDGTGVKADVEKTFQLLQRGDARGVFQLESDGIRELLKRMKPDNIRDLIATNALYRPGPLGGGMVDAYVNRKHGREVPTYQHPVMEEILNETYGVIVYQEQCMRVLNRLGGIELASAYACIKAISKKKQEIIDQRHAEFVRGAQERGVSEAVAEEVFNLIVQFAGYGFNKCVVGETVIQHAETGERTTVGDLFRNRRPFRVHALGEDGKLRPRSVADVVWNGRKRVYRLRTILGKTIVATGNHPFRTLDGWTNLSDLKRGDRIAAPRRLSIEGDESWPRHEIVTLAGLLSEGNTCHPTSLYFYGNDAKLVNDFADAVGLFPDTKARITMRRGRIHEVCANTGQDARFKKKSATKARSGVATLAPPSRSGAFRWADELGILGRRATVKSIPPAVFRLCDDDVALFLGRLWAGDGFIANRTLKVPFYATSSPALAEGVQTLLLRFGIVSRIHHKRFLYRDGPRPGFTVHVLGEDSAETFLARIAPHCLGRERAVAVLAEYHATTRRGLTSKDTIPAEVRAWIREERLKAGLTWLELEKQSGVSMKEFLGKGSAAKTGFRRSTIARLAKFFSSTRLSQVAQSDVFWDRVLEIEVVGIRDTYDLTVDEDHNFVADGFIVHNSHSAAYAKLGYQTAYLKTHYTAEFMASLLSSEIDDSNKRDIMVEHIDDARRLGSEVLPPDINEGEPDFTVKAGKIVFGLTAVKGLGRGAAQEISRVRQSGGPFKDLFDFCERIDHKVVPKSGIEKLVMAGAFDSISQSRRAAVHEAVGRAMNSASETQEDRRHGQGNLFEALETAVEEAPEKRAEAGLKNIPEWAPTERLKNEKEALDFYISSHPLAQHNDTLRMFGGPAVANLKDLQHETEVFVGGMFTQIRLMNTKKPRNGLSRYARFKVEDMTGSIEAVMWAEDYARYQEFVVDDQVCFVTGILEKDREAPILQVTKIVTLEQGAKERTSGMVLVMGVDESCDKIDSIKHVLRRTPGHCPVYLHVKDGGGKWIKLRADSSYRIDPQKLVKADLETILGPGRVHFSRAGSA